MFFKKNIQQDETIEESKELDKDETIEENKEETIEEKALRLYPVKIEEVEGYKALDKNLKSFNGNYQYVIDKPNTYEGEINICGSGLHFCPKLKSLSHYCRIYNSRIFKVKAKVDINYIDRKNCINRNKMNYSHFIPVLGEDKLVGSEIVLLDELSDFDIYNAFQDSFDENIIASFEDFKEYRFCENLEEKKIDNMKIDLRNAGYTKLFSDVFIDTFFNGCIFVNERCIEENLI